MSVRFTVIPKRPYSLALTAERYTRFPEIVDLFDGHEYRRLLPVGRGALLTVVQSGGPARAVLEARLDGPAAGSAAARTAARQIIERSLGAFADVRPFYKTHGADAMLASSIRDFRGLRVAGVPSLWEALVTAILAQQVNLKFAYDIRRELALAFGRRARIGGQLYTAFPDPAALAAETPSRLKRFRLSTTKARSIVALARAFADGSLSEEGIAALSDEEGITRLTAFHGVGRWTAEIALLRGLGRTDIFPAGDLGVVKYLAQGLLGHRKKAREDQMRRFAERWKPHRGFALVYGYAELNRRRAGLLPPSEPRPSRRGRGSAPSRTR